MDLNNDDSLTAWVPQECTLPTAEQPLRLAEFDEVFGRAVRGAEWAGKSRLRLDLHPVPGIAGRVADLAAAETGCCSFFTFTLTIADGTLLLEVSVPPTHAGVLDALGARVTGLAGRAS
jgi:hypothetical protein